MLAFNALKMCWIIYCISGKNFWHPRRRNKRFWCSHNGYWWTLGCDQQWKSCRDCAEKFRSFPS